MIDTISVVGLGYIGLPTAAILASRKKQVIGVDISPTVVATINRGDIHIEEPDLDMVVHAAVTEGYLRATDTPEPADVFMIAVPTPIGEDKSPDVSYVREAAKSIAPVLEPGNLVILESTSPVGTTEQMELWLSDIRADLTFPSQAGENSDIRIAHCPERVLPGQVLNELVRNDRVVGGMTTRCSEAAKELYGLFVVGECVCASVRTAEMCKLAENSYRDVNIALANELSTICDELEINVWELIALANRHPRVDMLNPGPGVGGHCISVDPWFIVSSSPERANLIRTARQVNDSKPKYVAERILRAATEGGTNQVVCFGATFKPNIDDLRESPAVEVIQHLYEADLQISLVEPHINKLPPALEGRCTLANEEELRNSLGELNVILVAHNEFKAVLEERSHEILDFCGALAGR